MPASRDAFDAVFRATKEGLSRWLGRARDAVMAPWRQFKAQPNPQNLAATVPAWQEQVDRILAALTPTLREGWAAAHLPADFDPQDPYVQANLALTNNLLVRIPDEVHALVIAAILQGTNNGETTEQIAQRVDDILTFTGSENWLRRAQVIAQTEVNRHFNGSMLAHGLLREKAGESGLSKRWDTIMDGKERKAHELANDQVQPLGQPFLVDGERLLFPSDPTGRPANVINCVPGSARIRASGVEAIYRFKWSGPLVTVIGERSLRATVSPNHPVLTESGWVKACELQKGDYLIGAHFGNGSPGSGPNEQCSPPVVEEVFEALIAVAHRQRMDGLSVDFYGDRPHGDVDVVFTNGELGLGLDPTLLEHFTKFAFACADAPCAPFSSLYQFLKRPTLPPKGIVSFEDLTGALLLTHELPFDQLGLGLVTEPNASLHQPRLNGGTADSQFFGKSVDRSSGAILLDKVIDVQMEPIASTHLYTLQTCSGIYLADSIVSHNCRCSLRVERKAV